MSYDDEYWNDWDEGDIDERDMTRRQRAQYDLRRETNKRLVPRSIFDAPPRREPDHDRAE